MTKQANLFTDDLLPGYGHAQIPSFIFVFTVVLLCSAAMLFNALYTRSSLLEEQDTWQLNADVQKRLLSEFQDTNPKIQNQSQLERLNSELTEQLNQRRSALLDLASQLEFAIDGFSKPLSELSDYEVNGLWLDSIQLTDGKRTFNLTGFTDAPELISEYISQLRQSNFQDMSIQQLSIERDSTQNSWRFRLTNDGNFRSVEAQ